jgi:hypothetical protein
LLNVVAPPAEGPRVNPMEAVGESMIEEPKPEDPKAEDPRPKRLEKPMDVQSEADKGEARLTRDIQIKIGQQLRAIYTDVVDQGVPDRFVELLRRLDEGGEKKGEE